MLACWLKILCPDLVLVGTRRTVAALERDSHILAYRATHRLFDRIVAVSDSARSSSAANAAAARESYNSGWEGVFVELFAAACS